MTATLEVQQGLVYQVYYANRAKSATSGLALRTKYWPGLRTQVELSCLGGRSATKDELGGVIHTEGTLYSLGKI